MTHTLPSGYFSGAHRAAGSEPARQLLVVDDDPSVRHALWITFRDFYEVLLAEDGDKALRVFTASPVDVAILDVRMPGISGLDVLKRLKEIDPAVEVILLTAYENVDYVREALRLGACDYITKPFQVDTLRTAVSTAMDRREVSRKTAGYDKKLARLEQEVHHQQMREELARTRNEIYASIIHDINGPLTVIAGYVEIIQHIIRHAHVLEEDQLNSVRSHAGNISRQVANCIELSRRYLGFLEGKSGTSSKAEIKEVFYDVAELLKGHPQARSNELLIHPFNEDHAAAIHNIDLVQVLMNLTINALQASSHHHRVELYARFIARGTPRPFLQPAPMTRLLASPDFAGDGDLIAVFVQDNGQGIPEPIMEKIFVPYFTTKPPQQGTGLGLSIVSRLVLQARGAIHVYSHPGEGAVFSVYLPAAR